MFLFGKNKFKEWAEKNNLKYQEKVKLSFIRSENVSLEDLIWGEYAGKRIYLFKIINSVTGRVTQKYFYCNGNFYSTINLENIEQFLLNSTFAQKKFGMNKNKVETEIEMAQVLIAQIYIKSGIEIEFEIAKKIYKLLQKFYNSKVSFKDRIIKNLLGRARSKIKYNSSEAILYVLEKDRSINRKTIEEVANAYENLITTYGKYFS